MWPLDINAENKSSKFPTVPNVRELNSRQSVVEFQCPLYKMTTVALGNNLYLTTMKPLHC